MSNKTKISLIVATSLILIGSIIFLGVMTMLKWDFNKLSTVKYETNVYEINEKFNDISVNVKTANVTFSACNDSKISVECFEQKNVKHTVNVIDGKLVIKAVDTRKWYEYIGFSFKTPKVTVYLPLSEYGMLNIKSNTGNIQMPKGLVFESIDVSLNTGKFLCEASAMKDVKIKSTTGDIHINDLSANSLDLSVTTGDIVVQSVTCQSFAEIKVNTGDSKISDMKCESFQSNGNTGDISLKNVVASEGFNIERGTGDVSFDSCDAAEIFVETSTGDVKGNLLSDKVFIAKSDTGKVNVPKTVLGGRCEIKTDTGNITLSIVE